nr:immunoglobulin heavy chain junction region [Macaca mulatta]MOV57464.1 immunoglobulin heavy chain junction region [Macaca mulatta]MOV59794.1 immunoglobulin heavy chain junction region [Macaca mulatta]MOV59818.1 immunoglobulin heavy chain junction region [Macaca mulatta]MOV60397.1 immunoglobulin heavy chain junction region [Macaca mulatta]
CARGEYGNGVDFW